MTPQVVNIKVLIDSFADADEIPVGELPPLPPDQVWVAAWGPFFVLDDEDGWCMQAKFVSQSRNGSRNGSGTLTPPTP